MKTSDLQFGDLVFVQIIKCNNPVYWYHNRIGEFFDVWESGNHKNNICGFSISYDNNKFRNTEFPHLFGKNHTYVSLATFHDVKMGDVSKRKVKYKNMVEETINLINA